MSYDNTNRGTMGRNKRREKDTHPEFTGKCDIEGVGYWISAWVKEANGEQFFSLSFKPKDAPQQAPKPAAPARMQDDDSIPF